MDDITVSEMVTHNKSLYWTGIPLLSISVGDGVEGACAFVFYPFTHQENYTDNDGWVYFTCDAMVYEGYSRGRLFISAQTL